MRWIAAVAVVACSAPAAPVVAPAPASPPIAPVTPVMVGAAPASEAFASYAGERCAPRVEAMQRRFAEAAKAGDLDRQNAELPLLGTVVDGTGVDLSRGVLSVTVRIARGPPQVWLGDKELRLTGESWHRQIGRAVLRASPDHIDLWLQMPESAVDVRPLVGELAGLGTLRLMVRHLTPSRIDPLVAELPARVQRFDVTHPGVQPQFRRGEACVELDGALQDPQAVLARAPASILACGCAGLDVDLIEAWVLLSRRGDSVQLGWLTVRIDPKGTLVETTGTALDLTTQLGALSAEDRARGIRFEPRRGARQRER